MDSTRTRVVSIDWEQLKNRLDVTVLLCVYLATVLIPLTHMVLHRSVITPLGRAVLQIKDKKKIDECQEKKLKVLTKFQESAWKFIAFTVQAACTTYALSKETFWKNTDDFWTDCSRLPCEYEASPSLKFAYAVEMAFYLYAIPYCLRFETRRKDFMAHITHHIATVILIGHSYMLGFLKVGSVIMLLHDVNDPLLELAKLFKYIKKETSASISFVVFVIAWIATRVSYFPVVIYSVAFAAERSMVSDDGVMAFPHYQIFASLLFFLWILHVYWTYFIIKIAVRSLLEGTTSDVREQDDDDD